jgi:hypothetical protein
MTARMTIRTTCRSVCGYQVLAGDADGLLRVNACSIRVCRTTKPTT